MSEQQTEKKENIPERRADGVTQCLQLISELEDMVTSGRRYVFSEEQRIINARVFQDRLQMLHQMLPASVKKASTILNEADAMRKSAEDSARQTRENATR